MGPRVPAPPWTWLRQVHGAAVVEVAEPGQHAGAPADAAVTATPGCVLLVRTADCAPVVLQADGVVGVVHAGWRGLIEGVIDAAVRAMGRLGAGPITATLGPTIRAGCYEFGGADLDTVAARFGPTVRGVTSQGTPALDLPAGVVVALAEHGIDVHDDGRCTACDPQTCFSHRARADTGRLGTFAWIQP